MDTEKALKWIEEETRSAIRRLIAWSSINSWSENTSGLLLMEKALKDAFSPLADETHTIPLTPWQRIDSQGKSYLIPLGNALLFTKREPSILLGGHMDTVFPPSYPFEVNQPSQELLSGPGVADMKGGLLVLWLALSAFERYRGALSLGWKVLVNPDEEIGSPGSQIQWQKHSKGMQAALLFEPAYPDGAFVDTRKGSDTAFVLIKGTPAHVGRDYELGKSAVKALSLWINEAYRQALRFPDATLNIAGLSSSNAINIIPEVAACSYNLRSFREEDLKQFKKDLEKIGSEIEQKEEVKITIFPQGSKPPKPWTTELSALFEQFKQSADQLNLPFSHRPSGGLCDGNFIAGALVPCIDTLGVVGGGLHTSDEYMVIKSLTERAKLTCHFLFQYAKKQSTRH